jgi:hypothetical protein
MAKADGPQAETSMGMAGLPPSYGLGIQQGMYNRGIPQMMNGMIYPGFGGGMRSTMPGFNPFMQQPPNWMRAGFNFGTPISSPNLFQGLYNQGSANGGRITDPNAPQRSGALAFMGRG